MPFTSNADTSTVMDMTLNVHIARIMAASAIVGTFGLAAWGGSAIASADEQGMIQTIDLTDVSDIDSLPTCTEEDCSDQVGQIGVWIDRKGDSYLERGEDYTRLIIDNTVTGSAWTWGDDRGYDAGYEN